MTPPHGRHRHNQMMIDRIKGVPATPEVQTEDRDEVDPSSLPFIPLLPSAITPPNGGGDELARLIGARIIRIGTTTPGLVEGGGLIIDYRRADGLLERLVLAFSERGMWVEHAPKKETRAARAKHRHNQMMIDRIKGVPATPGTPESDADPRNPSVINPAPTAAEVLALTRWLSARIAGFMWQEGSTPLGALAAQQAVEKFREVETTLRSYASLLEQRQSALELTLPDPKYTGALYAAYSASPTTDWNSTEEAICDALAMGGIRAHPGDGVSMVAQLIWAQMKRADEQRQSARDAALEECEKIADSFADHADPAVTTYEDGYQNAAMSICEAIRALKRSSPPAPDGALDAGEQKSALWARGPTSQP